MSDTHDLQRFRAAQDPIFAAVTAELRAGHKRSHWMWFIFPQIAGLGRSETARHYAIADLDEARAYIDHPSLGPRLVTAAEAAVGASGHRDPIALMGEIDAVKLRSSATLFEAAGGGAPFALVLDQLFAGERDAATLSRIGTFTSPS